MGPLLVSTILAAIAWADPECSPPNVPPVCCVLYSILDIVTLARISHKLRSEIA